MGRVTVSDSDAGGVGRVAAAPSPLGRFGGGGAGGGISLGADPTEDVCGELRRDPSLVTVTASRSSVGQNRKSLSRGSGLPPPGTPYGFGYS